MQDLISILTFLYARSMEPFVIFIIVAVCMFTLFVTLTILCRLFAGRQAFGSGGGGSFGHHNHHDHFHGGMMGGIIGGTAVSAGGDGMMGGIIGDTAGGGGGGACGGHRIKLTKLEFELFVYLYQRKGKAVTRAALIEDVWGWKQTGSNVIEAVVRSLRKKLGAKASAIETIRGSGYRFRGL